MHNCQNQVQFYRNCPSLSWRYSILWWQFGNAMILNALVFVFHIEILLCPVNFNTVYWEIQSNADVCWQKFYRWWQDSINTMCTMLVFVSLSEILLYTPCILIYCCEKPFCWRKTQNNVCIGYRDLLTHIFLLKVWDMWCDGLWNKLLFWQPD